MTKEPAEREDYEPGESLGQFLKRERSLRGVSLREISDTTKIGVRYLEALEDEDFEALPPRAFIIGFLRAYAACLRVDPEEVILLYERVSSRTRGLASEPVQTANLEDDSSLKRILLFVFAGLLVVSLFYAVFVRDWSPRVHKAPTASSVEPKKGS